MDFDGSPIWNTQPKIVHLGVGQSNAAPSPIAKAVDASDPAEAIPEPVNHDRTAGVVAAYVGSLAILLIWVGDMHGQVVAAARISVVDAIPSFGSPAIPLANLCPVWLEA